MDSDPREFIRNMSATVGLNYANITAYAAWILEQHTVAVAVHSDLQGSNEVLYCECCGQGNLDEVVACDHILRLAALWSWHPDYDKEEWAPMEEDDD